MRTKNKTILLATLLFVVIAGSAATVVVWKQSRESAAYRSEIEQWHAKRVARLQRAEGWLSLVALDWLKEGSNEFPSIGTITLRKGMVHVKIGGTLTATLEGRKFVSGNLRPDTDDVAIGTRTFTIIMRNDRFAVRMWDSESPVRKSFSGIERFPLQEKWKVEARWEPFDPPKKVVIATVIPGLVEEDLVPGAAVFSIDGHEERLEPTLEDSETDYFFVFGDETNGKETYGGGRFLYAAPPKDGKIILDFNKAYNPPCAFTEFATCPLPAPGNRMNLPVEAGERKYIHP